MKQVPDTAEIKIDPQTNTLIRSGVESIVNPFDLVAIETALRLKERHGGQVTALSMGPTQSEQILREALSLGADGAVLLTDRRFAGADTLATSYTLARAITRLNADRPVDLVLCGKQAIDGDTGQTGPGLASRLGYTLFTYVTEIPEIDEGGRQIQVKRRLEEGIEILRGHLPALLTVELQAAKPRRASLPLLIASQRAEIARWDAETIQAEPQLLGLKGSATWVRRIFSPPVRQGGPQYFAGDNPAAAIEKLLDALFPNPG